MTEKCKYCSGVYRKSQEEAEVLILPRQKKICLSARDVDMLGQMHIRVLEIPCKYCPNCGRAL